GPASSPAGDTRWRRPARTRCTGSSVGSTGSSPRTLRYLLDVDDLAEEPAQVQELGEVRAVLVARDPDLAAVGGVQRRVVPQERVPGRGTAPLRRADEGRLSVHGG